jgi:hypothetical protein
MIRNKTIVPALPIFQGYVHHIAIKSCLLEQLTHWFIKHKKGGDALTLFEGKL